MIWVSVRVIYKLFKVLGRIEMYLILTQNQITI